MWAVGSAAVLVAEWAVVWVVGLVVVWVAS